MSLDRRNFIRKTLHTALGGASLFSAMGNLNLLRAAVGNGFGFPDYKALVCVFLYGGMDGFNAVIPYTQAGYTAYQAARPSIAIPRASLANTTLNTTATSGDGFQYALHPSMTGLRSLFNQGHAAIVANVGTLVRPTTQTDTWNAMNGTAAFDLPPQLYSHADQAAYWQSSPPTNQPLTGWGGRIADRVAHANTGAAPFLTSMNGLDAFLRATDVNGYVMTANSASEISFPYDPTGPGAASVFAALHQDGVQANMLERTYARANRPAPTASHCANLRTSQRTTKTTDSAADLRARRLCIHVQGRGDHIVCERTTSKARADIPRVERRAERARKGVGGRVRGRITAYRPIGHLRE